MTKDLVLSDELLKLFNDFKHKKNINANTIMELLHFYKSHLTNIEQCERVGIRDKSLFQALVQNGLISQTLEKLTEQSNFKIILNTQKNNFPYLNITKDKIENNFTSTFYKKETRNKAKEHIKALLKNAKTIFIYDQYFKKQWSINKDFFKDLVPRKPLAIFYRDNHLTQSVISDIKKIYDKWNVKIDKTNNIYSSLHDRYLIIDDKIEIILTSGFDNLFSNDKDFTYILRKHASF